MENRRLFRIHLELASKMAPMVFPEALGSKADLSLTNVQDIWTIFWSLLLSPLRVLAYLMIEAYGWSTWRSKWIVCEGKIRIARPTNSKLRAYREKRIMGQSKPGEGCKTSMLLQNLESPKSAWPEKWKKCDTQRCSWFLKVNPVRSNQ